MASRFRKLRLRSRIRWASTSRTAHIGKERFSSGTAEGGRLLVTVHLELEDDLIRIISAGRATLRERRDYEEGV
jgi:uncharacterized DUF497 family protein